ncbi:src-like-adapter isoform X2 [Prionailurus iriomotensis]
MASRIFDSPERQSDGKQYEIHPGTPREACAQPR